MRFAVSVLTVLGIASILGTVLKQNEPYNNYIVQFGQFWFEFFQLLGLYDVYHCAWFLLILVFLVASTSLCIFRNTPTMLRELRTFREAVTEKSLRAFSHQQVYALANADTTAQSRLNSFLNARGFRFRVVSQQDGSTLIAAKAGSYQRLGYIFTHVAIVVICLGGIMDGNVPLKIQELMGLKKVEVLDIPASQVPAISRLSVANLSFRANMTLPEGAASNVSYLRVRDGYMIQELPFKVGLKDFRIEHYATGQPKSFESDIEILDPELKAPIKTTISVNHPFIYKGIAIYQSSFEDGGSTVHFDTWFLHSKQVKPIPTQGVIAQKLMMGEGASALKIEFNDFRKFNILNLSPDGTGKPRNVGANVTFKVRDVAGQAHEYVNYMQPLQLNGRRYFVSGMRDTPQEDFKYLKIPVDDDYSINGYMQLSAMLFDATKYEEIAGRFATEAFPEAEQKPELKEKFQVSVVKLLQAFSQGGYTTIAKMIEASVPAAEREKAAQTYIKIISGAAFEAYNMTRTQAGLKPLLADQSAEQFIQESLSAMSDSFFYGAPMYLQMTSFDQREASGLQLTRSPGKNLVYLGSVFLVIGIFAMIYIRERRIWFLVKKQEILFAMSANRKTRDFEIEFDKLQGQLKRLLES